jgi:hypothetical protein
MTTTPARLPWDPTGSNAARRPTIDDFGGAVLSDVPELMPPPYRTHWSAKRGNYVTLAAAAFCRTTYIAKFDVAIINDLPIIRKITVPGEYVNISAFSIAQANGPGNPGPIEVTWVEKTLPPNEGYPVATLVMSGEPNSPGELELIVRAKNITNGVRVEFSGSSTHGEFTVMVF